MEEDIDADTEEMTERGATFWRVLSASVVLLCGLHHLLPQVSYKGAHMLLSLLAQMFRARLVEYRISRLL